MAGLLGREYRDRFAGVRLPSANDPRSVLILRDIKKWDMGCWLSSEACLINFPKNINLFLVETVIGSQLYSMKKLS